MRYDCIVIGAGPAGLAAAIRSGECGASTLVLEKNREPGKKLLLSGTGQCNITHSGNIEDFLPKYSEHARFVKPALFAFTNRDLEKFFTGNGVPLVETPDGKLFPKSRKAKDVLDVFLKLCNENKVEFRYDSSVIFAKSVPDEDGPRFEILTENERFESGKLVIACGGASFPGSGSNGDGYTLAASLGHKIAPVVPGLTPVLVRDYPFPNCSGISLENVEIILWRDRKKERTHRGDVLFTHRGLSGPGILDFSRYFSKGDAITISLVPFSHEEEFDKHLLENLKSSSRKTFKNVLSGYGIPERLLNEIFLLERIPLDLVASDLRQHYRKHIVHKLIRMPFVIERLGDFNEAMVSRGGVCVNEVNRKTMESRLLPGLFFCGEVLDVDGACGGYNLQFAISSGFLAGISQASLRG